MLQENCRCFARWELKFNRTRKNMFKWLETQKTSNAISYLDYIHFFFVKVTKILSGTCSRKAFMLYIRFQNCQVHSPKICLFKVSELIMAHCHPYLRPSHPPSGGQIASQPVPEVRRTRETGRWKAWLHFECFLVRVRPLQRPGFRTVCEIWNPRLLFQDRQAYSMSGLVKNQIAKQLARWVCSHDVNAKFLNSSLDINIL